MKILAAAALAFALAPAASAQQAASASPPAGASAQQPMVVGEQPAAARLAAGTVIPLRTLYELTTEGKRLKPGERFDLEVSESVMLEGHVVIPAGARAVGEVTAVRNKGMWGKSGNIEARPLYVIVNDRQLRLTGALDDKGKAGGVGAVAVSALVFLPAGFFMTGTSARIPAGTQVVGRLQENLEVAFADGVKPQAPMTVGVGPTLVSAVVHK